MASWRRGWLVGLVAGVVAAAGCGDGRHDLGPTDAAMHDAAIADAATIDAAIADAATIDAAIADAATIDAAPDAVFDAGLDAPTDGPAAPVDAAPLAAALDPSFGQGGSFRFPVTSGMGAITTAADGDIVACGPSNASDEAWNNPPTWLGRVDADGIGPAQVWTVGSGGPTEWCRSVAALTGGGYAVLTRGRLMVRDAAGGPVALLPFDEAHQLLAVAAAPDGGLWAVGVEGLRRYDAALAPVPTFGTSGLVAFADGVGLATHGGTLATSRVTVARSTRQVSRFAGATGAPDPSFGGTGTVTVPIPTGWPSGMLRGIVARPAGAVAVFTDFQPPDPGYHFGIAPVSATGVPGPSIHATWWGIGTATVSASDEITVPSSEGYLVGLDTRLSVTRTNPGVTSQVTIDFVPPPACGGCTFRTAGATTSNGRVVGYTMLFVETSPFHMNLSARLIRLAP